MTLETLSATYDAAEAAFLAAVRRDAGRPELATLAREVARAAEAVDAEAYRKLHAGEEDAWDSLDQITAWSEVLRELWQDVAAAYAA